MQFRDILADLRIVDAGALPVHVLTALTIQEMEQQQNMLTDDDLRYIG